MIQSQFKNKYIDTKTIGKTNIATSVKKNEETNKTYSTTERKPSQSLQNISNIQKISELPIQLENQFLELPELLVEKKFFGEKEGVILNFGNISYFQVNNKVDLPQPKQIFGDDTDVIDDYY
jgi:hypothetical protein